MCTMSIALVHLKRLSLAKTTDPHALVAEQSMYGKHCKEEEEFYVCMYVCLMSWGPTESQ